MSNSSIAKTHENYSPDWWTPPEWWAWVKATIGAVPFDPCPADWNGEDGLSAVWPQNTYCNHPGYRGSTTVWWPKFVEELQGWAPIARYVWCGFNIEQLRHMRPSPFTLPGWLVMPRSRVAFINGRTGEVGSSPGNWTFFWTNVPPATPPVESVIVRTA